MSRYSEWATENCDPADMFDDWDDDDEREPDCDSLGENIDKCCVICGEANCFQYCERCGGALCMEHCEGGAGFCGKCFNDKVFVGWQ